MSPSDAKIESFELMYGTGGHGGPYFGIVEAIDGAKRYLRGCVTEHSVYIILRNKRPLDRANAVMVINRRDL